MFASANANANAFSALPVETIRAAIKKTREGLPAIISDEVRKYVTEKAAEKNWMIRENIAYHSKHPSVINMFLSITGTAYSLSIEAPIVEGTLCKVVTVYGDGGKHNTHITEVCPDMGMLDDIMSNAEERIQHWDTNVTPILKSAGFAAFHEGKYELFTDGVIARAFPSLYPTCKTCMLIRQQDSNSTSKLPQWVVDDAETLKGMIYLLKVNPQVKNY